MLWELFFLVPKLQLGNGGLLKLQLHVVLLAKPELGGGALASWSLGTRSKFVLAHSQQLHFTSPESADLKRTNPCCYRGLFVSLPSHANLASCPTRI